MQLLLTQHLFAVAALFFIKRGGFHQSGHSNSTPSAEPKLPCRCTMTKLAGCGESVNSPHMHGQLLLVWFADRHLESPTRCAPPVVKSIAQSGNPTDQLERTGPSNELLRAQPSYCGPRNRKRALATPPFVPLLAQGAPKHSDDWKHIRTRTSFLRILIPSYASYPCLARL